MSSPTPVFALLVALALVPAQASAQSSARRAGPPASQPAELDLAKAVATVNVNAGRFGFNVLVPVDTAERWERQDYGTLITRLGATSLRFPGGELADQYDWKTNRLGSGFAAADASTDNSQWLDSLQFLRKAKAAGATNISFVVNLEGAFKGPPEKWPKQVEAYAENAAQWVKAVKEANLFVPYWEIGNESYLPKTTFPLTAEEYANAFLLFAEKMKAADPRILLGANGPMAWNTPGFMNRLAPAAREQYRSNLAVVKKRCKKTSFQDCLEEASREGAVSNPAGWWATLAAIAGPHIDFAALHNYYDMPKRLGQGLGGPSNSVKTMQVLQQQWQRQFGHRLPMLLTEWNQAPTPALTNKERQGHFKTVAEAVLAHTNAGVHSSMYWPLSGEFSKNQQPLLPPDTPAAAASLAVLELANRHLNGSVLSAGGVLAPAVYATVVRNDEELAIGVLNTGEETTLSIVGLKCGAHARIRAQAVSYRSVEGTATYPCQASKAADRAQTLPLQAESFTLFSIGKDHAGTR